MKSTTENITRCQTCKFFEPLQSKDFAVFNCKWYGKGEFSPPAGKLSFYKVERIIVEEKD